MTTKTPEAGRQPISAGATDDSDLPEGLRRPRKSATPARQSWSDLSKSEHYRSLQRGDQQSDGITRDQRGQVQPKDKKTAQRT